VFERIRQRTQELKDYHSIIGWDDYPLAARTENGLKVLDYVPNENPDFSGQGGLMWKVYYYKKSGEFQTFGPMDTRELRQMHTELYMAPIDWTNHGVDAREVG